MCVLYHISQMKNILILWATWWIGHWILNALAGHKNYKIIIIWRNQDKLIKTKKIHKDIQLYCADLSNPTEVQNVFEKINKKFDIDVVINAVWLSLHGKFEKFTTDDINTIVYANYLCLVYVCKQIWWSFMKKKEWTIINISSLSGVRWYENWTIYCSMKAAVNMFLQTLAIEGQPYWIKITNILPWNVNTWTWNLDNEEVKIWVKDMLQTWEIWDIVKYIISLPKNVFIEEIKVKSTKPMVYFSWVHSKRFIL